jgi:hypothetical protein
MSQPPRQTARNHQERPFLLILCAALGIGGCLALILGTLIASAFVPGHDWIADTISDLAAGEWEIIMDVALYGFAAGLMATALAASHAHLGAGGWTAGVMALAALGALVVIIGARNEYGDRDSEGVVIHIYLVYALGALFAAICATMAGGLKDTGHRRARWALIALGVLWVVMAPVFLMSPTGIDGLLERALGLIACGIVVTLCVVFLRRGLAGT